MAQLNSSVVQGSLRVTDTTYTTNENISSLTASQAVVTDANKNLISRNIYNKTSAGNLEWTSAANDIHLVTKNTLAYWNGLYNASSSNLAYCNKGAFGNMAIKTKGNGFSDSSNTISVAYGTSANTAVQGNQTIFTLNGSTKNSGSSNTSFYAPTSSGATNQILVSGGTNAPVWTAAATLVSATNATSGTAAYTNLTLGNSENVSSATAHSEGKITLYSAATNAHIIQGQSATNDFTHTLPNSTGWVATGASTGAGDGSTPIYLGNNGILSAVSSVSYSLLPTNDSFILTEGDSSANPPAVAQATIPSNYALNRKIFYSQNEPSVTNADLGMFWFQPASFTMEDLKCLIVGVVATDTTSVTINNDDITTDMVVVKCVLSNPSAQVGDLTWTTTGKDPEDPNSHGNIVVNGTINGTTAMTFYLIHAR